MARILTHMHAHLVMQHNGEAHVTSESWDEVDFVESGITFDEVIEQYREHGYDSVTLKLEWSDE